MALLAPPGSATVYLFTDLAGVIGYVLSSSSKAVASVQENILSDNELGNIVQSVFDDVSSIASPKQVIRSTVLIEM